MGGIGTTKRRAVGEVERTELEEARGVERRVSIGVHTHTLSLTLFLSGTSIQHTIMASLTCYYERLHPADDINICL